MLQEVHGDIPTFTRLAQAYRNTHAAFFSEHDDPNAGGVITFVAHKVITSCPLPERNVIAKGRILEITFGNDNGRLTVINIHNHDIDAEQRHTMETTMNALRNDYNCDGAKRQFAFIAGDFNFQAPGERPIIIGGDAGMAQLEPTPNQKRDAGKWKTILKGLTEAYQPDYTRIGAHGTNPSTLTRIDRQYLLLPPYIAMQLKAEAGITMTPSQIHNKELSDHAPVYTRLSTKKHIPHDLRPIPQWLTRHEEFKIVVEELQINAHLDTLSPVERWQTHKALIRQASRTALQRIMSKPATTIDEQLQSLATAARALWRNEPHLIKRVTTSLPELENNLTINTKGDVTLTNPRAFQDFYRTVMLQQLEERKRHILRRNSSPYNAKAILISKFENLWSHSTHELC